MLTVVIYQVLEQKWFSCGYKLDQKTILKVINQGSQAQFSINRQGIVSMRMPAIKISIEKGGPRLVAGLVQETLVGRGRGGLVKTCFFQELFFMCF